MKRILHVDDDENDRLLLRLAFRNANVPVAIKCARDGKDAITVLEDAGGFWDQSSGVLPDVVLLDLNMAGMDGFDVLTYLRSTERFQSIPVYMLTSSGQSKDRDRALALGANRYFVKTASFDDVVSAVARLFAETESHFSTTHRERRCALTLQ